MDTGVKKIETLAKTVTEQAATLAAAAAENEQAEIDLLTTVVDTLRPALRALSSRIQTAENVEDHNPDSPEREDRYHDKRGIYIPFSRPAGGRWTCAGPLQHTVVTNGRVEDGSGPYRGTDLFLMEDGSWLELSYRGRWTRWQGGVSWWTSTPRKLSFQEVVGEYDIPDLLGGLAVLLDGYVTGNARTRAKKLSDNAAKIRAMLALL